MTTVPGEAATQARAGRAQPLSPQERRESILDAAVPLFMVNGADVTTRQIAEAAGVAEGTVFRVFEDKQAIIDAVVARFMDPAPTRSAIAALDPNLPLEHLVAELVDIITARFQGVLGIMAALGLKAPPNPQPPLQRAGSFDAVHLLGHHRKQLRVEPALAVQTIRMLCFARALPTIESIHPVTAEQITQIVMHGIAKEGA